jgi:ATP-binding cassette, subfamily C, bacterial CydC
MTLQEASAAQSSMLQRFGRLVALLGPQRRLFAAAVGAGFSHHLLTLAAAGTSAWLVGRAATGASIDDLRVGLVVLVSLIVPVAATAWLDDYLSHLVAFRALVGVRGRIYAAFERLAPGYLLKRRSGDLGAAAISDVELLELFFAHTLGPLVVAVAVPVTALIALIAFHPALALALALAIVLLASVPFWLRKRGEADGVELRSRIGQLSADAVDTLQGLRELVIFGAGSRHLRRLRDADRALRDSKVANGLRLGIEHAATDAISVIGLVAVLATAALLVTQGALAPELFPVAVVLAVTTFQPVIAVTEAARDLNLVLAAAGRIDEILNAPAPVTDRVSRAPDGPITPRVRFDGVTFRYAPDLPDAVTDVSFDLAAGETIALVGHSGAGKSTCAQLLLRMWDVCAGAITIGGHDLRDFPQEELRRLLTLVPQDAYLFNVTLHENIRLGRPDASDDDVRAAARAALADEFIRALPDGYDTVAGELGSRLSGGQRQRIAIARALLKDAPVLVMDEAVANLDAASEQELTAAMAAARQGRTTLAIAHRLSTIRSADRVVVLDRGRVMESGTPGALISRDGAYRRLVASQMTALTPPPDHA